MDKNQLAFYEEIHSWITNVLKEDRKRPFVFGISSPNGAGKSTLTTHLVERLLSENLQTVGISVDDFYLTHDQQQKLAMNHPDKSFLQMRGYPGTHDIGLGCKVLKSLQDLRANETTLIPQYDKSAFNGQGDRRPESDWKEVSGPIDVILLEGWMLGFCPINDNSVPEMFKIIDESLNSYQAWTDFLDGFLYLKAKDPDYVINWRIEAEDKRRDQGLAAMTKQQAQTYAQSFVDAISLYQNTPTQESMNLRWFRQFELEKNRLPLDLIP